MKKVTILGSTGSIGTQALDVIRENREDFHITALTCGSNVERIREQIKEFKPEMISVAGEEDAKVLQTEFPELDVHYGEEGQIAAAESDCDVLLNSVMGMRGLVPTCRAIEKGRDIALANKETLVAGGQVVMDLVKKHQVKMLPVDSEHSAIFQCLQGNEGKKINKILLTASGGPFRNFSKEQLANVTKNDALKHPTWEMGAKITIDSATMMNKGFEVIEAKWLFGVEADRIQVLVHPQSIIHSAVQFADGAVKAQLGVPDMRLPIQYAFSFPERLHLDGERLNLFKHQLEFFEPDMDKFRCLALAYEAINKGGNMPCIVNAANEIVNRGFLEGKCAFLDMPRIIERTMQNVAFDTAPSYDTYIATDTEARRIATELMQHNI